ncbi:MAG: UDP-N-acetylmuramoyl-L-alanine--D-glutamate ligase, partial [Firmicutes bacterium]|nr:UDP-N-acetylmuramoyl-L-alanine--D-glutamate ligase [Bacillota bacterium]
GVKIYDDSKATNCDSAITAVRALRGKIVIILGGSDKGENFGPLFAEFIKRGGIFAVLSGTTAGRLADAATEAEYKDFIVAETFEDAVERAYTAAIEQSASLLLSPACASFDRFESFEQRGDYFIQLAQLLRGTK